MNIQRAFNTALSFARFFFRSPKDQAVENAAAKGMALWQMVSSSREFAEAEDAFEALAKAYGFVVERNPTTNHIAAVSQPAGKWIMTQGGHLEFQPGE